jgi:hypothetical protein
MPAPIWRPPVEMLLLWLIWRSAKKGLGKKMGYHRALEEDEEA